MDPQEKTLNSNSALRILLWDIDGTLIRSARSGAFKDYTIPVLEAVFGTAGRLADMKVSGMTDLQIVCEALQLEGFTPEHVRARLSDLQKCYMAELRKATANGNQLFQVMPGAREILSAVANHQNYRSALLTGNIEPAAHLKMELVGLTEFFQLRGAFGDESHDRRDLPEIAAERICQQLGTTLIPSQFIVIGDTPNDIACAKHFGARALAVATGRLYSYQDLVKSQPDAIVPDLTNMDLVLRTLAELS